MHRTLLTHAVAFAGGCGATFFASREPVFITTETRTDRVAFCNVEPPVYNTCIETRVVVRGGWGRFSQKNAVLVALQTDVPELKLDPQDRSTLVATSNNEHVVAQVQGLCSVPVYVK